MLARYVGIPYETVNCWDLAVLFYKEQFQIDLRHLYEGPTPDRADTKNLIFSSVGEFTKAESPRFGDIMLLKIFGIESHIAVYVGEGKMLHTIKNTGSVIDRVDRWRKQLVGYYRVVQNDQN